MKKNILLFSLISCVLLGCDSDTQLRKVKDPGDSTNYITIVSRNNELEIVRNPPPADLSYINHSEMMEMPTYNPDSDELPKIDLRSSNLALLKLDDRIDDLLHTTFDSKTVWPNKLPSGYNPLEIMELGKNPGLGLRSVHSTGITGKDISIAIIDQSLLTNHTEYYKRLALYEEIHCGDMQASLHGAAVASIVGGKTVGVAPEAKLYYIATTQGSYNNGKFVIDLAWIAKSIERIIQINKELPSNQKIRAISICNLLCSVTLFLTQQ